MRVSSCSERQGFVLGYVGAALLLLGLLATTMYFMTSTSLATVARETGGQVYLDLCTSALNEVLADMTHGIDTVEKWQGLNLTDELGPEWPFTEVKVEPKQTRALAERLFRGAQVDAVTVRPVERQQADEPSPIAGTLELTARATGRVGRLFVGRELVYRVLFTVPCRSRSEATSEGLDEFTNWGSPFLHTNPIGVKVVRL